MNRHTRRAFIKSASLLPFAAATVAGLGGALSVFADEPAKSAGSAQLKVSLTAYSFNKLLNDNLKGRGTGVTLLQVLDFAAKCRFDAIDATAYYFPGYPELPPDSYVKEIKQRAADLGLGISGTAVRDNLTTSDKTVRAASVQHIKEWAEVAARIGAPVIRVFADTQLRAATWHDVAKGSTRDEVQAWIADDLRQCADHGKQFGTCIGVWNHGDFLQTGGQLLALINAVGSDFCKPIVDIGNFKTPDPYADMAIVAPRAINWNIKQSVLGEESEVPVDLIKLLHIVRNSDYRGYLSVETLAPRGKPYDPYTVVPAFLKKLRDAIAQTA